jgi:hypothetical protein
LRVALDQFQLRAKPARMSDNTMPEVGQGRAFRVAVEQPGSELVLQFPDRSRQRRLRDMQEFRGGVDAALFGDGEKRHKPMGVQ